VADDDRPEERPTSDVPEGAGGAPDVPAEQRGAARQEQAPPEEPVGDRSGGAGSGTSGGVLESPGGPGTVTQEREEREEDDKTLAEELVEEEAPSEVSPDMGTIKADPGAGGVRFDELVAKRTKDGLSDQEADELGRLMAEREGREWTSTRSLKQGFPADSA